MNWNKINSVNQLDEIIELSKESKVFILKHSTRCSISATALNRLERKWKDGDEKKIKPYYLDLIQYREISNEIAERFKVRHESPQLLLVDKGKCIYHSSHFDINYEQLMDQL